MIQELHHIQCQFTYIQISSRAWEILLRTNIGAWSASAQNIESALLQKRMYSQRAANGSGWFLVAMPYIDIHTLHGTRDGINTPTVLVCVQPRVFAFNKRIRKNYELLSYGLNQGPLSTTLIELQTFSYHYLKGNRSFCWLKNILAKHKTIRRRYNKVNG